MKRVKTKSARKPKTKEWSFLLTGDLNDPEQRLFLELLLGNCPVKDCEVCEKK
jgi:hypothetical protein